MFLGKNGCGFPLLAGIALVLIAILASGAHAQCYPRYGEWQPMVEVVWQPAPGLTIGFSTGPIYSPPIRGGFQPYFLPPPPIFYGGPPQYGYGGFSPAYQQGYDNERRRQEREWRDAQDQADRERGRRDAQRGISPAYGRWRY